MTYVDLGPVEDTFIPDDEAMETDLDAEETEPDIYDELSEDEAGFNDEIIKRIIFFCEELAEMPLRPYQRELAYRIIESLIMADAEEMTALWSRQSGKSETLSIILAGCMVIFPLLGKTFPSFERFKRGLWVGTFAPVDGQAEFLHGKIVKHLTSDHATEMFNDPELDVRVDGKSKVVSLNNGSFCRRQTANPKAKIEGASYHLIVVDEAQDADDQVVKKSIHPMLASVAGTMVKIGTPSFHKGDFYRAIQTNKRRSVNRRGGRVNHFEYDWKTVAKYNPLYAKYIAQEKIRLGEDSDEFLMCVTPATRVLTADLRHVPAGDLQVGDLLVGFDDDPPAPGVHRKYREAKVLNVDRIVRPSYRLELEDGTVVSCSAEHRWLVTTGGRTNWKTTEQLTEKDHIFKMTEVWEDPRSYDSGYLAAAFDGEGHLSNAAPGAWILGFSQRPNVMLDEVRRLLDEHGFTYGTRTQPNGCVTTSITGGRCEILRFLGMVRPQRLLDKIDIDALGSIKGKLKHPRVVSKAFLGEQEVITMETSTGTFVAEGLASHNSYALKWQLDRGMLVTEDELDYLADPSMPLVKSWHRTPCVVGIDPARIKDSTVVTVCWVDWDFPDPAGYREHRILNWLEIHNTEWEDQYFQIVDFLDNYNIAYVGVDAQGMGSAVAERLKRLLEHRCEVIPISSDIKTQSERWKHLIALIQRRMIVFPGHSKAKRTRVYKKFRHQMEDAEKVMKNQYMLIQAPEERDAHDDYVDSLALACSLSMNEVGELVETFEAPWFR